MSDNLHRVESLFNEALNRPPAQRPAFLQEQCGDDAETMSLVQSLLNSAEQATASLHDGPTGELSPNAQMRPTSIAAAIAESAGSKIGPYTLAEPLGEGGFGTVYLAEQHEPVHRRVALKVIKLGMDTKQVVARFEAERQALAMMDHPNIARVLDGGATDSGRPFFVMDLVQGEPITHYCDKNNLSIRARLELFCDVCHAVQHAHQKGIIHRDIKPSNVLVTIVDGKPVPKVIDFGIAKATVGGDAKLTEKTIFTQERQMVGTPAYMSPEQAEGGGVDVDTRSDVYALGVLLYELLTGSTPFDPRTLRGKAYGEIQRMILKDEPPKPSTRLSVRHDALRELAEHRQTDPKHLTSLVRGELDWIVMRCLEKERDRRYETANALAADVKRYLNDEPVAASPPSRVYRLRKLVRRNRGTFAAAALVFLALSLGMVGTSYGLVHAQRERYEAEQARAEAELRAHQLNQVADFQASQLAGIDTALMGVRLRSTLFEQHQAAVQRTAQDDREVEQAVSELERMLAGTDFTAIALVSLDENIFSTALNAIDQQFADQPLVKARLLHTIADTMRDLGLLDRAMEPQQRALEIRRRELGEEHPETLMSLNSMAGLLQATGHMSEAESYYRTTFETRMRVLGEEHRQTLESRNNLGNLMLAKREFEEAERYFRETLEVSRRVLGNDDPDTLSLLNNLGLLLASMGELAEGEGYFREALERRRDVLGDEHPDTLVSISNMGFLLEAKGEFAQAEPLFREALQTRRQVLSDEHPQTLLSMNNMGALLKELGDLDGADSHYRTALRTRQRVLGEEHPDTLISMVNLGGLLRERGEYEEAEQLAAQAIDIAKQLFSDGAWQVGVFMGGHGRTLMAMERYRDAKPVLLEAHERLKATFGPDHAQTAQVAENLADLYDALHEIEPQAGHDAEAARWRGSDEVTKHEMSEGA